MGTGPPSRPTDAHGTSLYEGLSGMSVSACLRLSRADDGKRLSPPSSVPSRLLAADGPARRAASRASCCTQNWMLSVINWPRPTATSTVNLLRPTTVASSSHRALTISVIHRVTVT